MKNSILVTVLLFSCYLNAQVGINNIDPKGTLDVTASNQAAPLNTDGVIIPRINTFPATNPGADQNSMLVYLTTTVGSNPSGFYYWNNPATTWTPLGGNTTAWDLLGNTGTISGTNFIGTTDAQALDVRTNNIIHQRFTTNGRLEFLNTGGSVIIGEGTGLTDDGTDNENVFIGKDVAPNVSTGSTNTFDSDDNIGIAREALNSLTDGTNNVAIGREALETITTNEDNIAIGSASLKDLTAGSGHNGNIAIGSGASANRVSGGENTIIGYNSEVFRAATGNGNTGYGARTLQRMTDGDYNTAIGYDSGSNLVNGSYNTLIGRTTASGNTSGEVEPNMMASVIIGDQAGGIANFNNLFVLDNSIGTTPLLSGVFANDSAFLGGGIKDQGPYDDNRLAINIDYSGNAVNLTHTLTVGGDVKINDILNLVPKATEPAAVGSDEGDMYYDSTLDALRTFDGTVWSTIGSGGGADTQDLSITDATGTISLVDGGSVNVSTIADADADTKIQVEAAADEDRIRFDVAGSEKLTLNAKGQLEFLNTGSSILIGENSGNSDDLANRRNVLIGDAIAPNVSTGSVSSFDSAYNVGIGYQNLTNLTRGASNVAIGRNTLNTITTQSDNIAIGRQVLEDFTSDRSVFIGAYSGLQRTSGAQNTFLGYNSNGFGISTGGNNTGIGANVLSRLTSGTTNTVIGPAAGSRLTTGSYNTIIGENAGMASSASDGTVSGTVIIGNHAGENNTIDNLFMVHNRNTTNTSPKTLLSGIFANTTFNGLNTGPFSDNRVGINIDLGVNAANLTHTLTVGGSVKIETLVNIKPGSAPTTPEEGDVYFDATTKKLRVYNGTAWDNLN